MRNIKTNCNDAVMYSSYLTWYTDQFEQFYKSMNLTYLVNATTLRPTFVIKSMFKIRPALNVILLTLRPIIKSLTYILGSKSLHRLSANYCFPSGDSWYGMSILATIIKSHC